MNNKRTVFMISGATDAVLGGVGLMIYFGWLPIETGIEKWIIGLIGAALFFSGLTLFTFFLLKNEQR
ncbi:MAG: hypothetical protein IT310_00290 [Anaerolineales bacterium]|nr:hypothetical protein [Anaerolineales bacterium]